MAYIYDIARRGDGNIWLLYNRVDRQARIDQLSFFYYLLYGYIKDIVDKNIESIFKDQEKIKEKDPKNFEPKTYEDILQETLEYFKIPNVIPNVINEMECLKNISLASLKLVIINDLETGFKLDFLDFVPDDVVFVLKFPMNRGCVKHLRENIKLRISKDNVCYGDVCSYINRARLYRDGTGGDHEDINYYRGNSCTKHIAVHGSKITLLLTIVKYSLFEAMGSNKRIWNLSRLVCVAKLNVFAPTE